ncbi:potassium uptake protein TrkH [Desulfocucumis palustris]|uniref:Potassium uptake protein TrkH n=1 Tax=Desulfocucumis palustris TaxID=1898651 RepID=A0A2L2XH73_9FIRM|nr:TrkH family potassium uptake protein [Desulfocucumis palustris]GBF35334.1 potassium uptake protein TrkH [Desulfocucumis palustris]
MNRRLILRTLGLVLLCEAAAMVPSLFISFYYTGEDSRALMISIVITAASGALLALVKPESLHVGYREGFAIATFSWLLSAIFGSIPFVLSGVLPSPVDAFFETMSGFTTTGASVITDLEVIPQGILFWRSFTHWLGGMGIIVLTLALIPSLKIAGMQMYKAEVPGPTKSKMLPRIAQTSRELYKIYLIITIVEIIALKIAGMNWFDSIIHTFGTVATGGFSNKNASVGAYDNLAVEVIIIFFMIVCGMNFALHFYALRGNFRPIWKDPESRLYLGVILSSILLISGNLVLSAQFEIGKALRDAAFSVSSIITTTGYATADFDKWPLFSQLVLLMLMLIGGCAGSTGGAIKNARFLIMFKAISKQFVKLLHPQAVVPVRVGKEVISQDVVENVQTFFFLYFIILSGATFYMAGIGLDFISAVSSVAATLGNVGPGFGAVGPMTNYSGIPDSGKVILSLCMLVGRLEIYSVILLLSSKFWR